MTYLYHNHRERENVSLFTGYPIPVQDLGCSPPCCLTIRHGGLICDFLIASEAKICDACTTGIVNQDVRLQNYDQGELWAWRRWKSYSFEVSVDYIAKVKIAKPFCDTDQLKENQGIAPEINRGGAYEADAVCLRAPTDVPC